MQISMWFALMFIFNYQNSVPTFALLLRNEVQWPTVFKMFHLKAICWVSIVFLYFSWFWTVSAGLVLLNHILHSGSFINPCCEWVLLNIMWLLKSTCDFVSQGTTWPQNQTANCSIPTKWKRNVVWKMETSIQFIILNIGLQCSVVMKSYRVQFL